MMQIRALREKAGMTQAELAEKMDIRQSAVSNWESEISLPKAKDLPSLAKALGCTIDDLYADENKSKDTA